MARKAKGRPLHGWLIVDKPPGPTSSDVVAAVKRALGAAKAGHAGTLDPAATGVLAVALGEATKTVPFVADGLKSYRFAARWGAATATDDAMGAILATSTTRPGAGEIRAALAMFRGDILQVPPQVSAVKVAGTRAYARARAGEAMELAARPLRVERLELTAVPDPDTAEFELVCGKGGYVRSLARDLGRALGCLGHVATLRRVAAGPFTLAQAVGWSELEAGSAALEARLLPVAAGLAGLPEVAVTAEAAARLGNGNPAQVATNLAWGATAWASSAGRPVAVGVYRAGELHPTRVFRLDGRAPEAPWENATGPA